MIPGKPKTVPSTLCCDKNRTHVELSTKCNGKHGEYIQKYDMSICCVINLSKR